MYEDYWVGSLGALPLPLKVLHYKSIFVWLEQDSQVIIESYTKMVIEILTLRFKSMLTLRVHGRLFDHRQTIHQLDLAHHHMDLDNRPLVLNHRPTIARVDLG